MRSRLACCLTILALTACGVGETAPRNQAATPPSLSISDGQHASGNPDFFFLPPLTTDPRHSPNFDPGTFNGTLAPTVAICELNATSESQVNPSSACKSGGYSTSILLGPADVRPQDEMYATSWQVPTSPAIFFRIRVNVGTTNLGFLDVESVAKSQDLPDVHANDIYGAVDGTTLPVRFRIEQYALCAVPGVGPCGSSTISLQTGGSVSTSLPVSTGPSGVMVPPQPSNVTSTLTVQPCPDLNPRVTDLPTYGSCLRVTANPPLPPGSLTQSATIFICDLETDVVGHVANHEQGERITLHRLDVINGAPVLKALPHTVGCPVTTNPGGYNIKRMVGALRRGSWRVAGREALGLILPRAIYASAVIDQGGGGSTDDFSDFQFALPAKMTIASGDSEVAPPGSTLPNDPTVLVTDLGGDPVAGATVNFSTGDGTVNPSAFVTGLDGLAHAGWTLPGTLGTVTMIASGRGIAGADNNGPRQGIDPFQPIQAHFDPTLTPTGEIQVLDGSQTFTALSGVAFDPIGPGAAGYSYFLLGSEGETVGGSPLNPPAGWQLPSPAPSGWSTGGAAFGTQSAICSVTNSVVTSWLARTDLLLRKSFTTSISGTLTLTVQTENDAQIWIDGHNVTNTGSASSPASYLVAHNPGPDDDWWQHDGCADVGAPTFTVPSLPAGKHLLAIWAHNRKAPSFIDVHARLTP